MCELTFESAVKMMCSEETKDCPKCSQEDCPLKCYEEKDADNHKV